MLYSNYIEVVIAFGPFRNIRFLVRSITHYLNCLFRLSVWINLLLILINIAKEDTRKTLKFHYLIFMSHFEFSDRNYLKQNSPNDFVLFRARIFRFLLWTSKWWQHVEFFLSNTISIVRALVDCVRKKKKIWLAFSGCDSISMSVSDPKYFRKYTKMCEKTRFICNDIYFDCNCFFENFLQSKAPSSSRCKSVIGHHECIWSFYLNGFYLDFH